MRSSLLFKAAIIVLCGGALVVGAVPLGLYWFGLSNIDEDPVPPARAEAKQPQSYGSKFATFVNENGAWALSRYCPGRTCTKDVFRCA